MSDEKKENLKNNNNKFKKIARYGPLVTQVSNLISMREVSSESELGRRLVTPTSAGN